jgi:hypothetical protein
VRGISFKDLKKIHPFFSAMPQRNEIPPAKTPPAMPHLPFANQFLKTSRHPHEMSEKTVWLQKNQQTHSTNPPRTITTSDLPILQHGKETFPSIPLSLQMSPNHFIQNLSKSIFPKLIQLSVFSQFEA